MKPARRSRSSPPDRRLLLGPRARWHHHATMSRAPRAASPGRCPERHRQGRRRPLSCPIAPTGRQVNPSRTRCRSHCWRAPLRRWPCMRRGRSGRHRARRTRRRAEGPQRRDPMRAHQQPRQPSLGRHLLIEDGRLSHRVQSGSSLPSAWSITGICPLSGRPVIGTTERIAARREGRG